MRERAAMLLGITGAMLGWFALLLQLVLTLNLVASQGGTALDGLWRYLGYFTVIANIFAAATLTCAALRQNFYKGEFAAATAMILVGMVYSLLLRQTWDPRGWQKLADTLLHDLMPLMVTLFWLLRPHGHARGSTIAASLILPLGFCVYALVRGAFENWYPYPFLDVAHIGAPAVAWNCLGIGLAFLILAAGLAALDRMLARTAPVKARAAP